MAGWFNKQGQQDTDDNQGQFDPEKFKTELSASHKAEIDALKAEFTTQLAPVNDMVTYLKEQKAERERLIAAQNNKSEDDEEDLDTLWITNPARANAIANKGIMQQAQASAAIVMRQTILGSKEYYTGDFKDKVDAIIESQPLAQRANAQVLQNAYKIVLADSIEDIQSGKLKKQVSYTNFQSNDRGPNGGGNKEDLDVLSAEEKDLANKFGFTEKQWADSKRELNYV